MLADKGSLDNPDLLLPYYAASLRWAQIARTE